MFDDDNSNPIHKKFFKYFFNGMTHNLTLWIISKEPIHGYGIMKKLDEFFPNDDFKNNSSKIYPLLRKMEKNNLITGEWKINENNKQVKFYSITDEGIEVLDNIRKKQKMIVKNPAWINFFKEMAGVNIDEKCN